MPIFSVVCFASASDLRRAIEKFQGKDINGRRIKLTDDSEPGGGDRESRRLVFLYFSSSLPYFSFSADHHEVALQKVDHLVLRVHELVLLLNLLVLLLLLMKNDSLKNVTPHSNNFSVIFLFVGRLNPLFFTLFLLIQAIYIYFTSF